MFWWASDEYVEGSNQNLIVAYKMRAKPPKQNALGVGPLLGPTVPFDWQDCTSLGAFGNIFIQLTYEPKR